MIKSGVVRLGFFCFFGIALSKFENKPYIPLKDISYAPLIGRPKVSRSMLLPYAS